ncbi:hypothetical protein GPS59_16750 [Acinetobacter haemolyticus]|uniref:hypothetical protein n=1 Tax=Acinetobacter haemolyticus TaxID=29430 RepID=UPI00137359D5|nr:hypothetical protein [Acinetobacter haemolyticus]NAR50140.1 hypothetical protein [Acinetobacter haemolyticus]NAR55562.1 hypothetical protein [Acinetobacter haemolyticus]
MDLNNDNLPINKIIHKINEAAANNESLTLSAEEVKVVSEDLGDQYFVPVLTNEQIVQLCEDGKLGQPMFSKKNEN